MSEAEQFKLIVQAGNAENKAVLNQLLGEIKTERAELKAETESTISKIIRGIGITVALLGGVISIAALIMQQIK